MNLKNSACGCDEAAQLTPQCSLCSFHQSITATVWRFQVCAGDPEYNMIITS